MQGHGWTHTKKVSVPGGGGTLAVALPPSRPVLEQLTIWASSGSRVLSNMTFQARVNGKNFGASANVTGAVAADVVLAMNGATRDQVLLPTRSSSFTAADTPHDKFEFDVLLTNAGAGAEEVTLYFVGIGRDGGGNR